MVAFISAGVVFVLMKLEAAYLFANCLLGGFLLAWPSRNRTKAERKMYGGWIFGTLVGALMIGAMIGMIYLVLYGNGCVEPARYYYRHLHY